MWLGCHLAATLTPEEANESDRSRREGCIWSAARASGLEWDRWRCAAVGGGAADQREGWELAIVRDPADRGRIRPASSSGLRIVNGLVPTVQGGEAGKAGFVCRYRERTCELRRETLADLAGALTVRRDVAIIRRQVVWRT